MPDINPNLPLREWTVLSLRPQGQHAVAHSASELRGAKFLACSSIKLEALNNVAELISALACDHIIVTSPAAVRFASQAPAFAYSPETLWFALGEGSASALRKLGVEKIFMPDDGSHSENLLAMKQLQNLHGLHIGLLTAPGGRGLIESTLVKRGAILHVAQTYQRKNIAIAANELESLKKIGTPFAVLCSSHEVFDAFWRQLDPALRESMKTGLWVVSSERLQILLRQSGILNTTISPSPQPDAMLAHLEYVQTQQVR